MLSAFVSSPFTFCRSSDCRSEIILCFRYELAADIGFYRFRDLLHQSAAFVGLCRRPLIGQQRHRPRGLVAPAGSSTISSERSPNSAISRRKPPIVNRGLDCGMVVVNLGCRRVYPEQLAAPLEMLRVEPRYALEVHGRLVA
jgi:hypothetical protein